MDTTLGTNKAVATSCQLASSHILQDSRTKKKCEISLYKCTLTLYSQYRHNTFFQSISSEIILTNIERDLQENYILYKRRHENTTK